MQIQLAVDSTRSPVNIHIQGGNEDDCQYLIAPPGYFCDELIIILQQTITRQFFPCYIVSAFESSHITNFSQYQLSFLVWCLSAEPIYSPETCSHQQKKIKEKAHAVSL